MIAIANTHGYKIIAMETDKDHIHFLLSCDTTDKVCDIVKIVKQETTYYLWQKYGTFLSKQYGHVIMILGERIKRIRIFRGLT